MSTIELEAPEDGTRPSGFEAILDKESENAGSTPPAGGEPERADDQERALSPTLTSLAAFLSTAAAGWAAAGIFRGTFPIVVAFVGALIGPAAVALSYRTSRPNLVQALALPTAVVAGAIFVAPDATGGTANLPSLVVEAIRAGGLAQPPLAFDPGWRLLLVVVLTLLGTSAAALSIGLARPKLAVFLPVPVVFAAGLLRDDDALLSSAVALALIVAALAVSYGTELRRLGATSGEFEVRRLARGLVLGVLLVGALVAINQAGFLFPETTRNEVTPPQRPPVQPPAPDRVIFTVEYERKVPLRVGVLDVYDVVEEAWMLPPFDLRRFIDLEGADVPAADYDATAALLPDRDTYSTTIDVADLTGHIVPSVASPELVETDGFSISFDPRTQLLRLPDERARTGMAYELVAPVPPTSKEMAESPQPPDDFAAQYLVTPRAPAQVVSLLSRAPADDRFERLQFVRDALFANVIAAGEGQPVDLPPVRVAEMLDGGEASPYEITAAEALLARWAGVPARIGFGFYPEDAATGTPFEVRPEHGALWLEAYFDGHGWVPILGKPQQAKASISQAEEQPEIRAAEDLSLLAYAPVKLTTLFQIFVIVRYWLVVVLPIVTAIGLVWFFYPGLVKVARRYRRRRWASSRAPIDRILVAYGEFRDLASDLNLLHLDATPLGFLRAIDDDEEHEELAWLVTRAVWGDLRRDLRAEDAEECEDRAASLRKRLRRAQQASTRALAVASRASLRDPYTREIPNLWRRRRPRQSPRGWAMAVLRAPSWDERAGRLVPVLAGVVLLVAGGVVAADVVGDRATSDVASVEPVMPDTVAPVQALGLTFTREKQVEDEIDELAAETIVAETSFHAIRAKDGEVQGALQVSAFVPGHGATNQELEEGILGGIGAGRFELTRVGGERIHVQQDTEQRILVWFPPRHEYFEVFIARRGFDRADELFAAVLAFQRGEDLEGSLGSTTRIPDVRRGVPEE